MPIRLYQDKNGLHYYQYGDQKKYYFTCPRGQLIAYRRALKQASAIKWSQNRSKRSKSI